ncbi:MAG: hypothetical protein ABSH47_20960 [Bryobacteraceae bacterium]|jgi:hypothetical protein
MVKRVAVLLCAVSWFVAAGNPAPAPAAPVRPGIGKPRIMKEADVRPGMKGIAWTVFSGTEPEAVPIQILGIEKNLWGPARTSFWRRWEAGPFAPTSPAA